MVRVIHYLYILGGILSGGVLPQLHGVLLTCAKSSAGLVYRFSRFAQGRSNERILVRLLFRAVPSL